MYNQSYDPASYRMESRSISFPAVMKNVYLWMTFALAMTGLTAAAVATQPQLIQAIFANRILFWGLMIGELGLVFYLSARIMRMSFAAAGLAFAAYAILNGLTLSFIFMAYTMESIATTFFVTAGTFGAMSIVGYTIKRDLGTLGRILIMALIGVIIASVVNTTYPIALAGRRIMQTNHRIPPIRQEATDSSFLPNFLLAAVLTMAVMRPTGTPSR